MKKYMTKKNLAGVVAIFLGLGIVFGEKMNLGEYITKAVDYVSAYVHDTTE